MMEAADSGTRDWGANLDNKNVSIWKQPGIRKSVGATGQFSGDRALRKNVNKSSRGHNIRTHRNGITDCSTASHGDYLE
jgi:hypothetical protein